jgi:hypothetical protein
MARGITQDRVNGAADALLQRGERPTIDKVRAELGTGSPNTLTRLLEVWWAGLAERLAAQARANLPDIPESVQQAMMTLWSQAVVTTRHEADAQLAEREQELARREAEIQRQLEEAVLANKTRSVALSHALDELRQAQTGLDQERKHTAALQQSLAEAMQSLREAQTSAEAHRCADAKIQEHLRTDLQHAIAAETRWLKEVDRARQEAQVVARDLKSALAQLTKERQLRLTLGEQRNAEKREWQMRIRTLEKRMSPTAKTVKQTKRHSKPQSRARVRSS